MPRGPEFIDHPQPELRSPRWLRCRAGRCPACTAVTGPPSLRPGPEPRRCRRRCGDVALAVAVARAAAAVPAAGSTAVIFRRRRCRRGCRCNGPEPRRCRRRSRCPVWEQPVLPSPLPGFPALLGRGLLSREVSPPPLPAPPLLALGPQPLVSRHIHPFPASEQAAAAPHTRTPIR
jgi:hypothetical protein